MPKIVTLNRNGYFRRAYTRGKAYTDPALVTYVIKNGAGICRVGITTGKKIGNAVTRNRCRRIIRAAFSELKDEIKGGYDIVFVARHRTASCKSTDIHNVMRKHLATIIKK